MDRAQLLSRIQKATLTTTDVTAGMLPQEVARKFVIKIKESQVLSSLITQDLRAADTGAVDNVSVASRIIRKATENADDGYRAGATFGTTGYSTVKVRLPWEVTEDVFHGNIEGQGFEQTLTGLMESQFGRDLEDLEVNGDTASGDPFVSINDGMLKLVTTANGAHEIDGSTINAGAISSAHFFAARRAMPNKYINALAGQLRFLMSPARHVDWWEALVELSGENAAAQLSSPTSPANAPLAIPIVDVPSFPDSVIILTDPKIFHRIISWEIRKRRVTGETDATLAAKDKRFYVYFLKHDFIVEEYDAVVRINNLA